jgi:hypothetical protein
MPEKQKRGFAVMEKARRTAIARKGGVMAHKLGKGHEWTSEEAKRAGQKGGEVTRRKKQSSA